jgi:exo-1,4-beta-D-glucosaminidase
MPKVDLHVSVTASSDAGRENTTVTLENPTRNLAFFVHLKVSKSKGDPSGDTPTELAEVLPVLWEDNYISLLPGEKRAIRAEYKSSTPEEAPTVQVDGWNIRAVSIRARTSE